MNEQWQKLKETIIEIKSLANLMDDFEKQMSSSENPNKWIPVSERLPETAGLYLVTVKNTVGYNKLENEVFECMYMDDWLFKGWEYNHVVAWMPLPEPYRESEE